MLLAVRPVLLRRALKLSLRLAIGFALIALLLWTGLLDVRALAVALRDPLPLLAAVLLMFGTLPVAAVRWHCLLRVQRIRVPGKATLRVVLASGFFSTFLPGAMGGDLLRSGYIIHAARGRASTGLLSILMDRMLGLGGVLLFSAAVVAARGADIPGGMTLGIWAALAALALAGLLLHRLTTAFSQRVGSTAGTWRAKAGRCLRELDNAFGVYRRAPHAIATGLALSLVICTLDLVALLLVMQAMRIELLPWAQQALASTLALLANSLPFTPGGLGIGEAAFANAALMLEPARSGAPYASAFLAFRCVTILSTLPGAFVALRARPAKAAPAS